MAELVIGQIAKNDEKVLETVRKMLGILYEQEAK